MTEYKKKLIEVALPLDAINQASAREKSIRHGHPSTLHLWWARRPLAACRAILFASLVDDPSAHPDEFPTMEAQEAERQRLFRIIEELVKWENSTNDAVLAAAHAEIMRSTDGNPPPVLDPFCGAGSIPLEAQRLGLETHASDLNPVAVLITKALIEIPPKVADLPPVNPGAQARLDGSGWRRAQGLAEDVRHYGRWMRDEAERRIGELYPRVTLPKEQGGGQATVIAWLWTRTVTCPNPACSATMPLVRSFALSTQKGKQARVEPSVDSDSKRVRFTVRMDSGVAPEGTVNRQGARCIACGGNVPFEHIRAEGRAGRMSAQLMAVVADGHKGRLYLTPDDEQLAVAGHAKPKWAPDSDLPEHALGFRVQGYGMSKHRDLFTNRQLVLLATLSDLVAEAREQALQDGRVAWVDVGRTGEPTLSDYVGALTTYLGMAVSKTTIFNNSLARWRPGEGKSAPAFGRQAISMVWDYAEVNPFAGAGGDFLGVVEGSVKVLESLPAAPMGSVAQLDAAAASGVSMHCAVSTDPPYYDNIGYADLSDFSYTWLRHMLRDIYPDLFSTLLTPKSLELIAAPSRFGGDAKQAERFFETGLGRAFTNMHDAGASDLPMTVYYAFKQSESDVLESGKLTASTGWETMLEGLLRADYSIVGTWPLRTEGAGRLRSQNSNALASSVVLACRPRATNASLATRKEFLGALRGEMPDALKMLQRGNIAPVDLAQASIGPGMAIFSRYSKVLEGSGAKMTVRTALALINQALDEILAEQEGEFDPDTRWAIAWFEQHGFETGPFGDADNLCRAKNTSVQGMVDAGIIEAKAGKVRLLGREELSEEWDPATDDRLTVWEMMQHLLRRLDDGETVAAALARQLGSLAEVARDLAYRLYLICERKKWAQEALAYNSLVVAWPQIQRLAAAEPVDASPSQTSFEV